MDEVVQYLFVEVGPVLRGKVRKAVFEVCRRSRARCEMVERTTILWTTFYVRVEGTRKEIAPTSQSIRAINRELRRIAAQPRRRR